jgi:hypothetical protein
MVQDLSWNSNTYLTGQEIPCHYETGVLLSNLRKAIKPNPEPVEFISYLHNFVSIVLLFFHYVSPMVSSIEIIHPSSIKLRVQIWSK